MGDHYEKVKKISNDILEIIIPEFIEKYNLEINKPALSISNQEHMRGKVGRFIPIMDYGVIKIQEEYCKSKMNCSDVITHEIGHASVYQNCLDYKKLWERNDSFFEILDEGISQKFTEDGLKILKNKGYLNKSIFYYFYQLKLHRFPKVYRDGEKIVNYYLKKGVKMRELIKYPMDFKMII